jgi:beta-glucosidase
VTTIDSTPVRPFGFGLSYTTFRRDGLTVQPLDAAPCDGPVELHAGNGFAVRARVTNTGDRRGADVVQIYAHRAVASVTRPVAQLIAYARVDLEPGETAEVRFSVPASQLAYSDRALRRSVEPGAVELRLVPSCAETDEAIIQNLIGAPHVVTQNDALMVAVEVCRL